MALAFTESQNQFREMLAKFLRTKSTSADVRVLMDTDLAHDPQVWQQLCAELGIAGLHIPEAYGGAGFGMTEVGIVMEEMGRNMYCGPYFSSAIMAGCAILNAGTESQKQSLLPGIADGSVIATLALSENGEWHGHSETMLASQEGDTHVLNGRKRFVTDGMLADLLIVSANSEGGVDSTQGTSLYYLDSNAEGVTRTPVKSIDPTRKLAEITLTNATATLLGEKGCANLSITLDQIFIAFANEMAGGTQALFDSIIEYLKLRVQFGRQIGSFQALKHRAADLLLLTEQAKSTAYFAAMNFDSKERESYAPSMAKAAVSDAYMEVAKAAIQLHGGIGFTWENDTHLWYKRAKSSEVFFGSPDFHRDRFITLMEASA